MGKKSEAIATLQAAKNVAVDTDRVPGIKKLLRDLNNEAAPATGARNVPPAIAKEIQELQPQMMSIQRELDQVRGKEEWGQGRILMEVMVVVDRCQDVRVLSAEEALSADREGGAGTPAGRAHVPERW